MFWKPIVIAKPAGTLKADGELAVKFDRAPSQEWARIFESVWGEMGEGAPAPSIKESTVCFPAMTREQFEGSMSAILEKCLYETNSRQSEQVAKKMSMPATKIDRDQASSDFQSAVGTINWG